MAHPYSNRFMAWTHSPALWFFVGVLATVLVGVGLTLHLTSAFQRRKGQNDYLPILRIHTQAEAEAMRARLISFLFDAPSLIYAPAICQVVESLRGHFAAHWSRGEFLHRANPAALRGILADMQIRRSP